MKSTAEVAIKLGGKPLIECSIDKKNRRSEELRL